MSHCMQGGKLFLCIEMQAHLLAKMARHITSGRSKKDRKSLCIVLYIFYISVIAYNLLVQIFGLNMMLVHVFNLQPYACKNVSLGNLHVLITFINCKLRKSPCILTFIARDKQQAHLYVHTVFVSSARMASCFYINDLNYQWYFISVLCVNETQWIVVDHGLNLTALFFPL